jgi:hypothetical protein
MIAREANASKRIARETPKNAYPRASPKISDETTVNSPPTAMTHYREQSLCINLEVLRETYFRLQHLMEVNL